ncbi:MAG: hypothetical protein AAGK98_12995 [Pseudomonadota bacterium]
MTSYLAEDPRGLIHEAYAMEIGIEDARSIFLDWALVDAPAGDPREAIAAALARYGAAQPDHPMTAVLRAGLGDSGGPRRRGGRASRITT